jgi:hypothetical protein
MQDECHSQRPGCRPSVDAPAFAYAVSVDTVLLRRLYVFFVIEVGSGSFTSWA